MADERDRSTGQCVPLDVADGAHTGGHVDESHAPPATQGHPGGPGDGGQPGAEPTVGRMLSVEQTPVEHRRTVPTRRGGDQLGFDHGVGNAHQHQVDGAVDLRQGGHARQAVHRFIARVDQVDVDRGSAACQLAHQSVPETAGSRAGAHHRHTARLEHGPHCRGVGSRGRCDHPPDEERRRTRPARPPAAFWSAMAAFAACHPGIPQTPPPAWVAELPL